MLNVRRITLVGAVALLVGLAALVNAIPPAAPDVVMGTDPSAGSAMRAAALAAATTAYWYLRRRRSQQRAEVGNVGALPQGGRGGYRHGKAKGKPRRAWMKGIKAWRLRTEETPCMYETEYMCTSDMGANDVNNTMYKEFRRTFRIPFGLYQDIVESAYASGRFRDDRPGLKKKRARGTC